MITFLPLVGLVAFMVVSIVLGVVTPGYNWRKDYLSELSLGKYGLLQKVNFIVLGVSVSALAISLALNSDLLLLKIIWMLAACLGVPIVLIGIWDTDVKNEKKTEPGRLHDLFYQVGIVGAATVFFLVGWGYKNTPRVLIFSWLIAAFDFWWWKYSGRVGIKVGVAQRVIVFTTLLWFVVLAYWDLFLHW